MVIQDLLRRRRGLGSRDIESRVTYEFYQFFSLKEVHALLMVGYTKHNCFHILRFEASRIDC